jgi:hypothetical protein
MTSTYLDFLRFEFHTRMGDFIRRQYIQLPLDSPLRNILKEHAYREYELAEYYYRRSYYAEDLHNGATLLTY